MRFIAVVSALVLAACAGSPTPRTQYLLRGEAKQRDGRAEAPLHLRLGRIAVAPYLDQSGIVVETERGQVQAAHYHHWAEPLEAGLRSLLRTEISEALGYEVSGRPGNQLPWDYTVDVYVDRLHATMGGAAELDASYRITPQSGGGEVAEYRFSRSAPLPREGYAGVVDAEAELARQLARAIAASLREIGEAGGGF
jgi:uncharacterized lipoprotein YmbA